MKLILYLSLKKTLRYMKYLKAENTIEEVKGYFLERSVNGLGYAKTPKKVVHYKYQLPYSVVFVSDGPETLTVSGTGKTLQYMFEGGDWAPVTIGTPITFGDTQQTKFLYVRGKYVSSSVSLFKFDGGSNVSIRGNIMSLIDYENEENYSLSGKPSSFAYLFMGQEDIIDAYELQLPATVLSLSSYYAMFSGCTNLVRAPRTLPDMVLQDSGTMITQSLQAMFNGCTSLTSAPDKIHIKKSNTGGFQTCALMFRGCTKLEASPEIKCDYFSAGFREMFYNCISLKHITCLNDSGDTSSIYENWVGNVPQQNGTFVKKEGVNWNSGNSGIPTGWTVEERIVQNP